MLENTDDFNRFKIFGRGTEQKTWFNVDHGIQNAYERSTFTCCSELHLISNNARRYDNNPL